MNLLWLNPLRGIDPTVYVLNITSCPSFLLLLKSTSTGLVEPQYRAAFHFSVPKGTSVSPTLGFGWWWRAERSREVFGYSRESLWHCPNGKRDWCWRREGKLVETQLYSFKNKIFASLAGGFSSDRPKRRLWIQTAPNEGLSVLYLCCSHFTVKLPRDVQGVAVPPGAVSSTGCWVRMVRGSS